MSRLSDAFDFQQALLPTSGSVAVTGSTVDANGYDEVLYVVLAHCAATATVDLTFRNASGSNFSGSVACTASSGSVAVTQITASNDDSVWLVRVPVNAALPYQRMVATCATDNSQVAAVAIGQGGNHAKQPAGQDNTVALI
jgi:hypothetical protein